MAGAPSDHPSGRLALVRWAAELGAVTADALAEREGISVASARSRLQAAGRAGLLDAERPLRERPTLYTITRSGLRVCGLRGLRPTRVAASNAAHLMACAEVAASLERRFGDHRVMGEPALRAAERERSAALASAKMPGAGWAGPRLHRPDLVLWPAVRLEGLPVAVEVELTVKAPHRLLEICRAWARCRCVAGVVYLAAPAVEPALARAIDRARAAERVVAVPLAAVLERHEGRTATRSA